MKKHFNAGLIISVIIATLVAVAAYFDVFYTADSLFRDTLYNNRLGTTSDIIIIGVDEETLDEYGDFMSWSRQKTADTIEYLTNEPDMYPAVIGVDFLFVDKKGDSSDEALISLADNYKDIVWATNLVYRGEIRKTKEQELYYDTQNIDMIELPFEELRSETLNGYTNMLGADDGYVRYSSYCVDFDGELYNSFAYEIYRTYMENTASNPGDLYVPKTNPAGQFEFFFSGKIGEFSHVSMSDVLNGSVPKEAFKNKIVLIGAYAPGFQDAYAVGVDRGNPMHGVEIHANIIQAFMDGKTATDASRVVIGIISFAVILIFMIFGRKTKLLPSLILSVLLGGAWIGIGCLWARKGITISLFYVPLGLVLADAYFVINKYVIEKYRRKQTLAVFKKYVAPQIVDDLAATGDFKISLGGERREIAVLFVDVRGFTTLSEGLEPEQVVAILNDYLEHTTKCIFNHGGTLDKFIGDATMAVFNAPFDREDYIYEAVATAWDIAKGATELGDRIEKKHGKRISFGVGVNCGPAVVGNIGCDFRMDYTAIGDTVNTAARLESNAGAGQILISEQVYEALKDRICANSIGAIPLKGKSANIEVYEVTSIESKLGNNT